MKALTPRGALERELRRLTRDGFMVHAGSWSEAREYSHKTLPGAAALRRALDRAPGHDWCGFQLYFPMSEEDVGRMSGPDLIETMMAVFEEVTPAMNLTMQTPLAREASGAAKPDAV